MSNSHTEVFNGTLQEALEHLVKPDTVDSPAEPVMRGTLAEAIRFAVPPAPIVTVENEDLSEDELYESYGAEEQ